MALTGHSGMQTAQSMHSSGSITSMLGPSRKQSTGHTSTQSVYLQRIQDSVTTWVMVSGRFRGNPSFYFDSIFGPQAGPVQGEGSPSRQRTSTAPEVLWLAVSTSTRAPSVRDFK